MTTSKLHTFNIHQAKTHLSKLLDLMEGGEDVVIARAGKPIARLVAIAPERHLRVLGSEVGRVHIAADFDDPLPADLLHSFYS